MLNAFRAVFLAALLLIPTLSLAEQPDRDWFIRQINPQFTNLFEACGCPVYGFEDILTWEDQADTRVRYWSVTVVLSEKRQEAYWQTIGRIFTYKQTDNGLVILISIGETFTWNPT